MVYLIHLDEKFHHTQHYIGYAQSESHFDERLKRHLNGSGARYLRGANDVGIEYSVVRVWKDADRNFERRLKNYKKAQRFCPICNPDKCFKSYGEEEAGK